ncbi:lantibiotic dehydratase [Actinoplanes couchii]|uniref:lantibiotic dehydratase n=1 Tax=Actinoplanes couchii TaxID=403638 RepID=UPI002860A04C|nr:thiopeptide-type bacteriocin biosynthesis protein [Actinoplanes couchii]
MTETMPGFTAAVTHASADLAARIADLVRYGGKSIDVRAVTLAVMRYLLRATTRATPFGLFAGVAPATASRGGHLRWGGAHRPIARIQAPWLAAVLDRLESDERLLPHLMVRTNNLLVERADDVILEYRAAIQDPQGAPTHLRIKSNKVIRAVLTLADEPIRLADLIGKLTANGTTPQEGAERLINQMISQRLLLTNLRPPSTATDPLAYVLGQTEQASDIPLLDHLKAAQSLKSQYDGAPDLAVAEALLGDLRESLAAIVPDPAVGLDLRLDCDLVVPTTVTAEACRAASALTRLARQPSASWREWHKRFLDRYGLHALVPVLDVVDDRIGVGYPDGFSGEPAEAVPVVTDRDQRLIVLAQAAALRGQHEIVLDDAALEKLAGPVPTEISPTAELTVRVHAGSLQDIGNGNFQLSVVRASSPAFSTAGRFLDLFDEATRQQVTDRIAESPPSSTGALLAQLSAVTRYTVSLDVNRVAQTLPHLIPVGEHHPKSQAVLGLDDIAVTADRHRLYLVSISRQQAIRPVAVNTVEPVRHAHPLARFLSEAPVAFSAPCSPVEWGPAARGLPFLPGLRYGRTLLSPARWILNATELPDRNSTRERWEEALSVWLKYTGCPSAVSLGTGDQALGLDLNELAHRALLRDHLTRNTTALLRLVPAAGAWLEGRSHEIVIPLTSTTPRPAAPRIASPPIRDHGRPPNSQHLYLKIYARPTEQSTILDTHIPRLLTEVPATGTWWFLRHADPEPHLRLRIIGLPTDAVSDWTQTLIEADLTRRIQWDTDFGEPGRFGSLDAYRATTNVFMADSVAVLAQQAIAGHRTSSSGQALAAASMVDIVTAVVGDPADALRWLITHTRTHRPAPPRHIYDQAVLLANPYDQSALALLPGGMTLIDRWTERRRALAAWRNDMPGLSSVPPVELLPDLLHLHHVRVAGLDLDNERICLHLARAAALSWTTRSAP